VQEKTLANKPARVVGKVYEKLRSSRGLEGSDRGDHIRLESSTIIILKRPYKKLLTVNNWMLKPMWQLTTPVVLSGRRYETISLALPLTGDNDG
jgi:hypothetical protein